MLNTGHVLVIKRLISNEVHTNVYYIAFSLTLCNAMQCNWISRISKSGRFCTNTQRYFRTDYSVQVMIKYVKINLCVEFISVSLSISVFFLSFFLDQWFVCVTLNRVWSFQFNLFDNRDWQNVGTLNAHLKQI